MHEY